MLVARAGRQWTLRVFLVNCCARVVSSGHYRRHGTVDRPENGSKYGRYQK